MIANSVINKKEHPDHNLEATRAILRRNLLRCEEPVDEENQIYKGYEFDGEGWVEYRIQKQGTQDEPEWVEVEFASDIVATFEASLEKIEAAAEKARRLLSKESEQGYYASIFTIKSIEKGFGARLLHHLGRGPIAIVVPEGEEAETHGFALEMINGKLRAKKDEVFITEDVPTAVAKLKLKGYTNQIRLYTIDPKDKELYKELVDQVIMLNRGLIANDLLEQIEIFQRAYAEIIANL